MGGLEISKCLRMLTWGGGWVGLGKSVAYVIYGRPPRGSLGLLGTKAAGPQELLFGALDPGQPY